jgi:uncharacterized protein (TIGR03067 family)
MSTDGPASLPPPSRRWLSRKLRYLALLVVIGIAGYWLLPWIFMPADLRALQGTWKVVEIQDGGKEVPENSMVVIRGESLGLRDDPMDPTRVRESYAIELRAAEREMRLHVPEIINVFGSKHNVPIWLWRAKDFILLNYELDSPRLVLRLQLGDGNERKLILERQ